MAYSVSPRRFLASSGGKNSEKRSTRIPTAFAAVKWPASCRMISTAKPRKARIQLTNHLRRLRRLTCSFRRASSNTRSLGHELGRKRSRRGVALEELLEVNERGR